MHFVFCFEVLSIPCPSAKHVLRTSMGSIDEPAISNLSFIANLTKHIRVRAAKEGQDSQEGGAFEFVVLLTRLLPNW
jgi:hypothetical protein